jgi:hypothetical protein
MMVLIAHSNASACVRPISSNLSYPFLYHAYTVRFLDAEQAAVFLGGLNSRTVTRWAREGYLPLIPLVKASDASGAFWESVLGIWMFNRRTGTLASATDAPTGGLIQ